MKFLPILLLAAAVNVHGALAELNVPEGSIISPDGSFSGRDYKIINGFKLELLYLPTPSEGRWVAMAWDTKGRLLVPSYDTDQLARLTIPKVGSNDPVKVEMIDTTRVGAAEGVLAAFDSIYLNVNRSPTLRSGLYRLRDTNGDDKLDQTRVVHVRQASGDHGTHVIHLTPDGRMISTMTGNQVPPTDFTRSRIPLTYGEDNLVQRLITPNTGLVAPDGHIVNYTPDGSVIELYSIGMRNPVSMAYNKDGEMFVYDSDDEPEQGIAPLYHPTAIYHIQSGGDPGWRSAARHHPYYYFDNIGVIGIVGSGSPTGSTFGTKARFPARYQDALYICDWSFGHLYSVFLTPDGASYKADVAPFLSGRPLAVTNAIVNPADGSLLVQTSGTQLFRVTYVGDESTEPTKPDTRFAAMRATRHQLERFHGNRAAGAVAEAWPYLADADRSIRYAARLAVEWQDVASWKERALTEKDPRTAIAAIAALARASGRDVYSTPPNMPPTRDPALTKRMLAALNRIAWDPLPYQDKLDLMRAYQLVFIRLGPPDAEDAQRLIARFDPYLPSNQRELNWQLAELLIYLEAPSAATKVMGLVRTAPSQPYYGIQEWINPQQRQRQDRGDVAGPNLGISQAQLAKQEDQQQYIQLLRTLRTGWTPELRREYFDWFAIGSGERFGGNPNYLEVMRVDAISTLSAEEKTALGELLTKPIPTGTIVRAPAGGRGAAPAVPGAAAAAPRGGQARGGTPGLGAPAASLYTPPYRGRPLTDTELTQITRYDESMERQLKAQIDATNALFAASVAAPAAPASIQSRADALAAAELSLALARAEGFAKLKVETKIAPDRVPALIAAINSRGAAAGGGGGGGRRGGAPAPVPAPVAPVPARGGN